ncbi:hypothetical protein QUB17_33255 [Microcoleus sp. B5-C4]
MTTRSAKGNVVEKLVQGLPVCLFEHVFGIIARFVRADEHGQ